MNQKPSELELKILSILWDESDLTVREVRERIPDDKKRAYTTILSTMQVMERKGFITHDARGTAHVYRPLVARDGVMKPLMGQMLKNVFGGKPSALLQCLLDGESVEDEELTEIRRLIRQHAEKNRDGEGQEMIDLLTPQQTEWLALTLLHSLWQSLTLAILLSLVLRIIPAARASLRYLICFAALLSIPVCVLATWSWLNIRSLSHPESVSSSNVLDMPVPVVRSGFAWEEGCVVVWVIGVALMTLRIMFAFFQLQTLRNQSKTPNESIVQLVERLLKNDFLVRRVEILTTDKLTTAAVAGLFRPVLFIPAAMVTGLSERQLEAVLAHELAHIRRFDVVANLVQMLVEAGLFFNPAVWWISRQVRQEREACCDVAGVQASGDAAFYSETLATWAEQLRQLSGPEVLPAGAIGFAAERKSTLVQRIRRILFPHDVPKSHFSPWSTICLLLLGAALFGGLWKGTQIAVAIVDELLPHEVVVEELTRKREEFGGDQLPIVREIKNEGSMELDIRLKTPNGKPTNSVVRVSYATFEQHGHTSNSAAGNLAWLDVGEMQQTKELKFSWAHLMFLSKGYAPVVIRDVKPDESGKAVVNVDLDPGYDGLVEVKDEAGEPVSHVKFTLNHVLTYPRKLRNNRGQCKVLAEDPLARELVNSSPTKMGKSPFLT